MLIPVVQPRSGVILLMGDPDPALPALIHKIVCENAGKLYGFIE
jgi:hypothetical protein